MKQILLSLLVATSFSAIAGIEHAPPSFSLRDGKVVFVDFKEAHYHITYDVKSKSAIVDSVITFEGAEAGYPLFDLVPEAISASLNGKTVTIAAVNDPQSSSTFRIAESQIAPGTHILRIRHKLETNVVFKDNSVGSGFWMSDLNDRRYLEQYLPTNLEFDQYMMKAHVKIINAESTPHVLKTNGTVTQSGVNEFHVTYPEFYTASLMYFHLLPEATLPKNVQFYYSSIDGRLIPVDIYTGYDMNTFVNATKTILAELENDYGPFPHDQLIIYGNAPSGGMEYAGATATSLSALGHELFHSYHARGLSPANGNSGWMDEAIARFRDNKYPLVPALSFESTRLAGRSAYTRMTDRMAYTEGSAFLSWIAYRMSQKGLSFKGFLRDYFERFKFTTVTTELFKEELSVAADMDLTADFNKYIYGKSGSSKKSAHLHTESEDEFHRIYSPAELQKLSFPQ